MDWTYEAELVAIACGTLWCKAFAHALKEKGFKAYVNQQWDGYVGISDPEFWHLSPLSNGGVNVTAIYDNSPAGHTYDSGLYGPLRLVEALARVQRLPARPTRQQVHEAMAPAGIDK